MVAVLLFYMQRMASRTCDINKMGSYFILTVMFNIFYFYYFSIITVMFNIYYQTERDKEGTKTET